VLATDWVGTHLAKWLGLCTFEIAILTLTADDDFELARGYKAAPGPAFASRAVEGSPWSGSEADLDLLVNSGSISRLLVFDTWVLNCDRHFHDPTGRKPNFDNVFLSSEGLPVGKRRLIAMDHGLCFIRSGDDLTPKLSNIDKIKDSNLYGLFPAFKDRLDSREIADAVSVLSTMNNDIATEMISTVPPEWEVSANARDAWAELITRRAAFVADNVEDWIEAQCPWFGEKS
jgi:hypothetical protein